MPLMNYWKQSVSLKKMLIRTVYPTFSFFRAQHRFYEVGSIPIDDMRKHDASSDDRLGCLMPPEAFEEMYMDTLDRLGVSRERDERSVTMLELFRGSTDYDDPNDLHKYITPPIEGKDIVYKDKDGNPVITWPWQSAMPFAKQKGLVANVLWASLESERERNLKFAEEIGKHIVDGEGEMAFVVQFFPGRAAPIPFKLLNFLLEKKTGKRLTGDELKDQVVVDGFFRDYMDNICPGIYKKYKVNIERQEISAVQFMSIHASIMVRFLTVNGEKGQMSGEVGRPGQTYVGGKLVTNAHEQIVDQAVFQSMNQIKLAKTKGLKPTLKEMEELYEDGVTVENFYRSAADIDYEKITDEHKPLSMDWKLFGGVANEGTKKEKGTFLSEGVPLAMRTRKIDSVKPLAMFLYWVTGKYPWMAMRLGAYFAHDAVAGGTKSCELLAALGINLAGGDSKDLFDILNEVKQYDLSQEMRECLHRNFLYVELQNTLADVKKIDGTFALFSKSTAKNFLDLTMAGYATMQPFKEMIEIYEDNPSDEEAREIVAKLQQDNINFLARYRNMWANSAFVVLNLYRTNNFDLLLDPEPETITAKSINAPRTSAYLTFTINLVKEAQVTLKQDLDKKIKEASMLSALEFDKDTSVQEIGIKIAADARAALEKIAEEI